MLGWQQIEYKSVVSQPTSTAEVVLYTVPSKMKGRLLSLTVANTSTTQTETVVVHLRKAGVTASAATQVVPLKTVATSTAEVTLIPANGIGLDSTDKVSVVMGAGARANVVVTFELACVNA